MKKRHRNIWDDNTFEFKANSASPPTHFVEVAELEENNDAEFLEEAHEALSKLFNKTNKRAKQLKGMRRNDAWQ